MLTKPSEMIPLSLVFTRAVLGIVIFTFLLNHYYQMAAWAFFLAAITDLLDGALARKLGVVSPFGAVADAAADKILVQWILVGLLLEDLCTPAVLLANLTGDIAAQSERILLAERRMSLNASGIGKIKSILTYIYIFLVCFFGKPVFWMEMAVVWLIALMIFVYRRPKENPV